MLLKRLIAIGVLPVVLAFAPNASAATFMVNTTRDMPDTNPGDGVCRTELGQCSLRGAIQETNVFDDANRISVPDGDFGLWIDSPDPATDTDAVGDLDITGKDLVIEGSGATIIDANRIDRVFEVDASDPVLITRVAITGGLADVGGGVLSESDDLLTIENSTIADNRALASGGGLAAPDATVLSNTTVVDNDAPTGGGIVKVGDGELILTNTIVARNDGGNCSFEEGTLPIESHGGNLDSRVSCRLVGVDDLSNVRPLLLPFRNGVYPLGADSPAIDGAVTCLETDQRGVDRPIGPRCDIGAYERDTTDDPPPSCPDRSLHLIPANADSMVEQNDPAKNFGDDASLKVRSALNSNTRVLARFPLPDIPAGCAIIGSTLRFHADGFDEGRRLEVLRLASNWTELGVDWNNQPDMTGDAATIPSNGGWLLWPITDQLGDLYSLGNFGFGVRDAVEDDTGEQTFDSRETTDGPLLAVVFGTPGTPGTPSPLTTRDRLRVTLTAKPLRSRALQRVLVRFRVNTRARVRATITRATIARRGRRTVRSTQTVGPGRHTLRVRAPGRPGRYTLTLRARSPNGQRASVRTRLVVIQSQPPGVTG
jgi:CSLREA domain-containing protein